MRAADAFADAWEQQTHEFLKRTEREIAQIQADAQRRISILTQRKRALEEALRVYQSTMEIQPVLSPEFLDTGQTQALKREEIEGMGQKDILKLIAARNGNILVVAQAIRLMKEAHVFGNPDHSDSAAYSIILRSPEFVKIDKGIYKVVDSQPKPASGSARIRTNSGVRQAIRALKEKNPSLTRRQVQDALIASGFDFRGKHPVSAINMAWVAEGYAKKEAEEAAARQPRG